MELKKDLLALSLRCRKVKITDLIVQNNGFRPSGIKILKRIVHQLTKIVLP